VVGRTEWSERRRTRYPVDGAATSWNPDDQPPLKRFLISTLAPVGNLGSTSSGPVVVS
jgi:hypothetical protein